MYNLLEYSDSYEDYSGSLYQFKRVEQNVGDNGNIDNVNTNASSSFKYKASILGKIVDNDNNPKRSKQKKNRAFKVFK